MNFDVVVRTTPTVRKIENGFKISSDLTQLLQSKICSLTALFLAMLFNDQCSFALVTKCLADLPM